jgi:hypothetical protein
LLVDEKDYLAHYGILRRSGRYPWGSGGTQLSRSRKFMDVVQELRDQGMTDTEIARGFGISRNELHAAKTIARNEVKQDNQRRAQRMKDKGMSNVAIGERMKLNESSVRALLAPGAADKADALAATADMLKRQVDEKGIIDIGKGVEVGLGLTSTRFNTAVAMAKEQGYTVHRFKEQQVGTGKMTENKVLCPPGMSQKEAWSRRGEVRLISEHSEDGGANWTDVQKPLSLNPNRVSVRYAEDGGTQADGVMYVRRGVKDLSLGGKQYAQVRVKVGDKHYLKGMAIYKDDMPDGVDIVFNTNKSNTGNKMDAMKPIDPKADPKRPFGAEIKRQIGVPDGKGGTKLTSVMNIVNEQGDWAGWSKNLPSQMLSKQNPTLAKKQLDLTHENRKRELDELMSLTNPLVRKKLLESFAEDTDSAAVHLKAAAMPRQSTKVILPIASMKPTEAYIPALDNGTRVALVRFPHGGTFEIPEVTVNNKNREARKLIGTDALDAIGIHSSVAERLSGADFDGDTVLVIPNNRGEVKSTGALKGLKDFDPKAEYSIKEGSGKTAAPMGKKMGDISNLITDMTIRGASEDELARAVRHSMVVIDSEKHNLDVSASARANGISALKQRYQGKANAGAATLISRATSPTRIADRRLARVPEGGPVDKKTGRLRYVNTGRTYRNKKGEDVPIMREVKKLSVTDDAHTLVSSPTGTRIERIYADHSNVLKSLANVARKEAVNTKTPTYNKSAKNVYATEVADLNSKLAIAKRNAPLERQAQRLANAKIRMIRQANPDMDKSELKKAKNQALAEARARTGAGKQRIRLTPREWQAIQAGAISAHKLNEILDNSDIDSVRELATPRAARVMTAQKMSLARQKINAGYTLAEVAQDLGVPVSTLTSSLNEGG